MARTVKNNAAEAAEATKGFTPLKAGNYIAVITDVVEDEYSGPNSAGIGRLTLEVKVTESPYGEGEGVGNKIKFVQVPLEGKWKSGKPAFQFYQFFKALGVDFSVDGDVELPENDEIVTEEVGIVVGFREDFKQPGKFWPEVKGFFDPSEGVKESDNPEPPTGGGSKAKQEDDFAL